MFRPLVFLLLVGAIVALVLPKRKDQCPENEEWNDCIHYQCKEATCERPVFKPCFTKEYCEGGCVCKHGFFRHSHYKTCGTLEACTDK